MHKEFKSKKNRVYLDSDSSTVIKIFSKASNCKQEFDILTYLYNRGITVPRVIIADKKRIEIEYIPSVTYADIADNLTEEQAESLVNWLTLFYELTAHIPFDLNLRNFLWDGTKCIGIDFEDKPINASKETAFGEILAYFVSYSPEFSKNKKQGALFLLKYMKLANADFEKLGECYHTSCKRLIEKRHPDYKINDMIDFYNEITNEQGRGYYA